MSTSRGGTSTNGGPLVDLIFFDAGGGHRASAIALKAVAERQFHDWQIRLMDLRAVLEASDFIRRLTGVKVESFYNRMLRYGFTAMVNPMLPMMHLLIQRMHLSHVRMLARHWRTPPPDLVVSLVPHFNRAVFEGLRLVDETARRRATPMATILTDLADYPPHFWIERQDQYFFCGTATAARQALEAGIRADRILRTSGMIVRPEFYQPQEMRRADERVRLGLSPYLPTGIVMFGGYGSRRMISIARRVAEAGLRTQLILMCGHNQDLRERMVAMNLPFPHHIAGFTREIPYYMRLSDYFIGKPGPGSLSEALVMKLPVIVDRNASTMVQERYNTEWVLENSVGMVLPSFNHIGDGIKAMLDPAQYAGFLFKIKALDNRAVFEIPKMLAALMSPAYQEAEAGAMLANA